MRVGLISASTSFKTAADDPQRITQKKFVFNGTDRSTYIDSIEPIEIRQFEGDELSAVPLAVTLVNDDETFNGIITNKAGNINEAGTLSVGFDSEYVDLYKGKLNGAEFEITDRHRAILRFTAKLKACIETELGSQTAPLDYTGSAYNPADLTWNLLTVRGGLDSTQSAANTDIDYTAWLAWWTICDELGFSLKAYFTGETIAGALRELGEITDSLIYADPTGKAICRKFIPSENPTPYLFTEANAHLEKPRLYLNRDRIINRARAYYGYNPSTSTWAGYVTKEKAQSQTDYGLLGREFSDTSVWHDTLTSATAFAERLVERYYEPVETLEFGTRRGSQALLHQMGDVIQVTCAKYDYTAKNMTVYGLMYDIMSMEGSLVAEDLGVLNADYFILDSSTNGVLDQNVLY